MYHNNRQTQTYTVYKCITKQNTQDHAHKTLYQ